MLWIVSFLALYLLGLIGIAWISLHPIRTPNYISPAAFDAPQQDIEFDSEGNILRGWWLEAPESKSVIIFAHGYLMNKCELTPEAVQLWKRGASCMVFDHRAQGRSDGRKCGFGYSERVDIAAAVREAKRRKPGAKIGLVGSSMGSAAIAFAVSEDPELADAVVLDSCYSRFPSASLGWWRFLGGKPLLVVMAPTVVVAAPIAGFNPFQVDVAKSLKLQSKVPMLFLHGDRDNLALPSEGQRNFDAYGGPKQMVWFEGCRHSEGRWEQPDKYRKVVREFFETYGLI